MSSEITINGIARIRNMVREYAEQSTDRLWLDTRNDPPNPYYNQTATGLYLEQYYSLPNRLWTPWGLYHLGGSGSGNWDPVVALMLDRLGASVHRECECTAMGAKGPIYALSKVDDLALPEAVLRPRENFMTYAECLQSWNRQRGGL